MGNVISFNRQKHRKLKRMYARAESAGKESFRFEGVEILTEYARYLIEYLNTQFKE